MAILNACLGPMEDRSVVQGAVRPTPGASKKAKRLLLSAVSMLDIVPS